MNEPKWLHGLHDPGYEHLMALVGRPGWIVFTEGIGHDPSHTGGRDYSQWADQGFGVIVRLNNGYGGEGTIPKSGHRAAGRARIRNFVKASPCAHIWIIGNEMNKPDEWPDGIPIYPEEYAAYYAAATVGIHDIPGHHNDKVLVGAVAPWNAQLTYYNNPRGDWVQYLADVCHWTGKAGIEPDGFAMHAYTHGPDLSTLTESRKMDPPFEDREYNLLALDDMRQAIPEQWRGLPWYITEANQDGWADEDNGWISRLYTLIEAKYPEVRCCCLYCCDLRGGQSKYHLPSRPQQLEAFREALIEGYFWSVPGPPPTPPEPEDRVTVEMVQEMIDQRLAELGRWLLDMS